jgi:hypothetical protein
VLARLHAAATAVWTVVAGGAAAGFLARDVLGLRQPLVALAWILGAAVPVGVGLAGRSVRLRSERGQATVEFTALVLLAALALGALATLGPRFDGRSFGGFLAFHLACAAKRDCEGDRLLADAYGPRDTALVRDFAPNLVYEPGERQLPVDWRGCRRPACAEAPDERDLDVHRTDAGERATAFTRVFRRGGRTYVQYWLYYPDSRTVWAGSDWLWERIWEAARRHGVAARTPPYPGAHPDDWEAYAVRVDPDGAVWVRASSHGHWTSCKEESRCRERWARHTGWTRVSRGSHAGHIPLRAELREPPPGVPPPLVVAPGAPGTRILRVPLLPGHDLDERTTTSEGIRLIPLEMLASRRYRPLDPGIHPPWRKDAYRDPESDES